MLHEHGLVETTADGRLRVTLPGFPVLDAVVADLAAYRLCFRLSLDSAGKPIISYLIILAGSFRTESPSWQAALLVVGCVENIRALRSGSGNWLCAREASCGIMQLSHQQPTGLCGRFALAGRLSPVARATPFAFSDRPEI
jgi:hypothetical protein